YMPSGILSLAYTLEQDEELKNRLLWQKQSGLECEWWTDSQVSSQFPFLEKSYRAGFWAPQEGQVSSSRLALAFSESAKKMGVEFFEYESFDSVNLQNERLDFVETNVSKFIAGKFIFAAGSWTGKLLNGLVPVEPVKGQILIFQMPEKWPWRNQWESPVYAGKTPGHDPISCYFVPKMDGHIFLGATMENRGFDKSENKIATQRMADYATQIFPDLASFPFKGVWVGLRPGSPDGLPLMGLVPGKQNVYVASGHFRNGVLLAPITGKLFSDLIVRENHSALLSFAPNRN
ncbi:MAG: FAD-dependent oxidoreductase, partial [Elusimicrobia bacterium]|nr:FAD-dependent oxidoreductase [Elusimicrobiota bacterium]